MILHIYVSSFPGILAAPPRTYRATYSRALLDGIISSTVLRVKGLIEISEQYRYAGQRSVCTWLTVLDPDLRDTPGRWQSCLVFITRLMQPAWHIAWPYHNRFLSSEFEEGGVVLRLNRLLVQSTSPSGNLLDSFASSIFCY